MHAGFFILGSALLAASVIVAGLAIGFAFPRFERSEPRLRARIHHFIRFFQSDRRFRPTLLAVRYLAFTGIIWMAFGLAFGMLDEQLSSVWFLNDLLTPLIIFSPPLLFSLLVGMRRLRKK